MNEDELKIKNLSPSRGQFLFAVLFLAFSLLLLSQIGEQTKWTGWKKFWDQSRFWPAIGLGGMVLFTTLHMLSLKQRRITSYDLQEVAVWIRVIEFFGWFLAYVWLVPLVGYLPVTLVFMPVMLWRMGYRARGILLAGVIVGGATVLLFKTFLEVKIPGSVLYEYLPGALRNFMIINF